MHKTCRDVLYSTHILKALKCPAANTDCLQKWKKDLWAPLESQWNSELSVILKKNWAKIAL